MPATVQPATAASGPIKSLKRTFSSSTTASASMGSGSHHSLSTGPTGGLSSKILKKLDKSAFICDLDEDDSFCNDSFDWDDFDASVAASTASASTSATSIMSGASSSKPTSTTATTIAASKTTTSSTTMHAPPPRGPVPRPSVQMQSASSMLKLPSPIRSKSLSPSTNDSFPPASQYLPVPTSLPRLDDTYRRPLAKSTSAASVKAEQNENIFSKAARPTMALPEGALKPQFGKKDARKIHGQTSLDGFAKRESKSRQGSLEASTSDANKRVLPWDAADLLTRNSKSAKLDADSDAVTVSTSSKGKGNGKLVNIKQQIVLSAEQTKVLRMVVDEGKNVFFTGSAGTGKSILLREIIASLRRKYANKGADRVAITASTGIAAANIGGTTIHSFAGIGLGNGTGEQLIENIKKNRKASGRWMRTEVLIIDEVSMMDGDLFDKLCHIATRFRRKEGKPFGGIQLIITGDFFQLPPVDKSNRAKFAFEAASWGTCIDVTVNLTKVFRQKDTEFVDMLNEMRFGQLSQSSIAKFHKLKRQPKYADGLEPTELFPTREQVDASNKSRLAALPGEAYVYTAHDQGEEPPDRMQKTLENVMAPRSLTLKVNAQVMSIKNHSDSGIVNGTIGRVLRFVGASEVLMDDEDFGSQYSLEGADDDAFDPMAKREEIKKENLRDLAANDKIVGWKSKKVHEEEKVPVVEWQLQGGVTMKMKMKREEFKVEDVGDKVKAKRTQFPLILAYAMSIHKSQGQTLDRVRCDLGRIFEKGQAYVALSRCTSLDGLQILKFDPNKVLAHPKVVAWTKTLLTLN